ncbi:MAG: hypothetical protein QE277_09930 [Flectobacillus sp.]|nr:hypothetical protein [Flectobacillus sp.]
MESQILLLRRDGSHERLSNSSKIEINELDFVAFLLASPTLIDAGLHRVFLGDFGCVISYLGSVGKEYLYRIDVEGINLQNTQYASNYLDNISFSINGLAIGRIKLARIFSLNVGECVFRLVHALKDETLAVVEIVPDKLTTSEVEQICEELMQRQFLFFNNRLGLTRLATSNEEAKHHISVLELLTILTEKLSEIDAIKLAFVFHKFEKIERKDVVKEWTDGASLSEGFDRWIGQHTHYSHPTLMNDPNKLYIAYKPVRFTHGLYEVNATSTDVVENRLVHHLLDMLLVYLNRLEEALIKEQKRLSQDFEGKFVKAYHEYSQKKLKECHGLLVDLCLFFTKHIPVRKVSNFAMPSIERMLTRVHYAKVWEFNLLVNELLSTTHTYGNLSKVLKISNLSVLYEQYCFLEVVNMLEEVFETTMVFSENLKKASNTNDEIVVYYERQELFQRIARGSDRAYCPDFVISFKPYQSEETFLLILDAKYKRERSIEENDLAQLTLKYLHGMKPKDPRMTVMGLFLLFPKTEQQDDVLGYYQKDEFIREEPSFPLIGWVSLFPKRNAALRTLIVDIKQLVDSLG